MITLLNKLQYWYVVQDCTDRVNNDAVVIATCCSFDIDSVDALVVVVDDALLFRIVLMSNATPINQCHIQPSQ
jgi:hypothetical protein